MKKKIIQSSYIMISILLCIVITGCNEFSRAKAKKIILKEINSDNHRKNLFISYVADNRGIQVSSLELEQAKLLEQAGYVTISDYNGWNMMHPLPKIEPYLFFQGYDASLSVATVDDITITGIKGSDNYKEVEYICFYSLTEVGELLSYQGNLSSHSSMSLEKYDDGWRCED